MRILKKHIETASLVTCTNLSLRFTFKLPHVYLQNIGSQNHLSQGQMSNFTCVEPNAIEQEETIWLTGIRFNTYVVPKLYDLKLYKTEFSMRKGEV